MTKGIQSDNEDSERNRGSCQACEDPCRCSQLTALKMVKSFLRFRYSKDRPHVVISGQFISLLTFVIELQG